MNTDAGLTKMKGVEHIGEPQQHIAMTRFRCAPAQQIVAAKLVNVLDRPTAVQSAFILDNNFVVIPSRPS